MNYKIISTGSKGNSVLLNDEFLIDIGITFKQLNDLINIYDVRALFITHVHGDHLNIKTLKKLLEDNILVEIFCNDEVGRKLIDNGIKCNILIHNKTFKLNIKGSQSKYEIRPINLFHDVKNYGIKLYVTDLFGNKTSVFYATDAGDLEGIEAKGYDFYFIETNYDEEYLMDYEFGDSEFNRRNRTISYHLSKDQAYKFYVDNKKDSSKFINLHMSDAFYR